MEVTESVNVDWKSTRSKSIHCYAMIQDNRRRWGIRFEYIGPAFVLHVGARPWAMRFVLLGASVWFGKIPPKPVVTESIEIPRTDAEQQIQGPTDGE